MKGDQIIRVVCCLFPTGEAFWMEAALGPAYLSIVVEIWKEAHPEYTKLKVTGGVIELWMLRGDFDAMSKDNMELPDDFHERLRGDHERPDESAGNDTENAEGDSKFH